MTEREKQELEELKLRKDLEAERAYARQRQTNLPPLSERPLTSVHGAPGMTSRQRPYVDGQTLVVNSAAAAIRTRLKQKQEEYRDFLEHGRIRLQEEDLHGVWDVAVNATEVAAYIDGLVFALQAMGEKP